MDFTLEAVWNEVKVTVKNYADQPFTMGVFAWRRTGPFPFLRPDGSITNIYGPFEWVQSDPWPWSAARQHAGEGEK